ncbi:MAG: hypothetical protein CM15mP64_0520 [Candidatus Neomarinimicrobiota bacterium]|nr:MAG: hypothetical protein CM15mP64_0520 [Candidatus Neomarinimicrobiota bacterium]
MLKQPPPPKKFPPISLSSIKTVDIEHPNEIATFDPRWVDSLSLSFPLARVFRPNELCVYQMLQETIETGPIEA